MTGRDIFKKGGTIINFVSFLFSFIPRFLLMFLYNLCRNIGGIKGNFIRYLLIKNLADECGNNVSIEESVVLHNIQNIKIGDNVAIHPFCYIEAIGGVTIGNNVSIAHSTSIMSANHTWDDMSKPIKYNDIKTDAVRIEDDVWVGCGCRILAGVIIHRRSIVAAGAVVTKDVMSNTLVGGVPAKVIKPI
jgi:acetyltransferase-like isoleucine patch superfamily enzyme